MKKIIIPSMLLTSMPAWSQAAAGGSSSSGFLIITIVVAIAIFIICRELFCWYYKINKRVANQEEIIRLLKIIADNSNKNKE